MKRLFGVKTKFSYYKFLRKAFTEKLLAIEMKKMKYV